MPIYQELAKSFNIDYDEAGSIGKRYRREDEIGTPMCITVDFETETDDEITEEAEYVDLSDLVKLTNAL